MSLAPGTRLGPFEIAALIGSGGMGEVYRARDPRIGRDVAVKILRGDATRDPERLRRFTVEARAMGALNHPAVVALYDVGEEDGRTYVVSELLEGETLRTRLASGPLPLRRALELGAEIAHGLHAAHEKGIVHRDLKPENFLITRDGRIKILDFGLAKLLDEELGPGSGTGAMLGTTGYIAPEQAGGEAEPRSDIFALGAVLYEMLSGRRAFLGRSPMETMTAVMRDDPESLRDARVPPPVERVVRRCLEKRPDDRFQSARDLAFALEALAGSDSATTSRSWPMLPRVRRPAAAWVGVVAALAGAAIGAGLMARRTPAPDPEPRFARISFGRGTVSTARFAADGSVVYAAAWEGGPSRIYVKRSDDDDAQALDLPAADLLSVSSHGQLAVLLRLQRHLPLSPSGTLATFPLAGGAPRELLDGVRGADWSPDGDRMAIVRDVDGRSVLEVRDVGGTSGAGVREPRVLHVNPTGYLSQPRFSPRGTHVAVITHRMRDAALGAVMVLPVDGGEPVVVAPRGVDTFKHLVWSADGSELLFTRISDFTLVAATLDGKVRELRRSHSNLGLQDMTADGRMLATDDELRMTLACRRPGETADRDLSWLQISRGMDLSADGHRVLFTEYGGDRAWACLRDTQGGPVVRLGQGEPKALSPDGASVLMQVAFAPPRLALVPTGAGDPRPLPEGNLDTIGLASFLPDGRSIVFAGSEPGRPLRIFVQDLAGGPPRAVSPEGLHFPLVAPSPDGRLVAAVGPSRRTMVYTLDGSAEPREVPGLEEGDQPIRFAPDGSLFAFRFGEIPARIVRVDVATGARRVVHEVSPRDPAGVLYTAPRLMTPAGDGFCHQSMSVSSRLYLATTAR